MTRLAAALFVLLATPAYAQDAELRAAFDQYRAAIAAKDWAKASQLVNSETVMQFERVRDAALYAGRESLLRGSLWVAITALGLRHYADPKAFDGASGRTAYALARGMSTLEDEPIDGLAEIAMPPDRSRALARGTIKGEPTERLIGFAREDGKWRVAWQPLFATETQMLTLGPFGAPVPDALRAETIEKELFETLRERTGRAVSAAIWQAPRTAPARETPDQVAVRAAFQMYRNAVVDRDWPRTAELVDDMTVRKYGEVRNVALHAAKKDLVEDEFWIAASALALRHASNAAEIDAARGRAFVALANRLNVLETLDATILEIGAIRIDRGGNRAFAPVIVRDTETDYLTGFLREGGHWRLAWVPLMENVSDMLTSSIGITPWTPPDVREIVFTRDLFPVLRERTGRDVTDTIWQPLQGRTP